MAATNPQKILGNWLSGIALDLHTLSSVPLGVNEFGQVQFDTTYSELGELLHRLKYQNDMTAAQEIIDTASNFLRPRRPKFDILVPVPPSTHRPIQPVMTIAKGIGSSIELPVVECVSLTHSATPLKNVTDRERRTELLEGLYSVDPSKTSGKRILLFDDLYRSGATMNAITDLLMQIGKAASVCVLTITRTRKNQ